MTYLLIRWLQFIMVPEIVKDKGAATARHVVRVEDSLSQIRLMQQQVGVAQAIAGGEALVPVGVDEVGLADLVEPGDVLGRKLQLGSLEVVLELRGGAAADDHRSDERALQQPGERDLRAGD